MIVEVLFASVAELSREVRKAITLSLVVTRDSNRSMRVAIARSAPRVAKPTGHALIATFSSKVFKTRTLSLVIAVIECANMVRAVAGFAVGMIVKAAIAAFAT